MDVRILKKIKMKDAFPMGLYLCRLWYLLEDDSYLGILTLSEDSFDRWSD